MPPLFKSENVLDIGSDRAVDDTSDERFDRGAFARRAIELVRPRRMTVAICEGATRLRVESGRLWGRPLAVPCDPEDSAEACGEACDEKWALLAIPADASRRAIALAVAGLAHGARAYALDVLIREAAQARAPSYEGPAGPVV
ncbi:MAG TPA: hypothetical protein VII82_09445 [Polyangiaceae bacterium]|jgi:hypothetical protein